MHKHACNSLFEFDYRHDWKNVSKLTDFFNYIVTKTTTSLSSKDSKIQAVMVSAANHHQSLLL